MPLCDMEGVDASQAEDSEWSTLLSNARQMFSSNGGDESGGVAIEGKDEVTSAIDFNLYKQFWGIQQVIAGDPGKTSTVTLPLAIEFTNHADVLLSAFEANAFTDSELEQSRNTFENMKQNSVMFTNRKLANEVNPLSPERSKAVMMDSSTGETSYAGCKYLTSSQLFALQLKDPIIREQICAQLLVHLHYMKSKLSSPSEIEKVASSFPKLENRIYSLLRKTPPNGSYYLKALTTLLNREQHWTSWKKKGCVAFEKSMPESANDKSTSASASATGHKRKRNGAENTGPTASKREQKSFFVEMDPSTLQCTLGDISKKIPSFDNHIESYVEADDPEAGIEEEYHPKNDSVYCWRARRLLADQKLAVFEDMADGDISKGLKKLLKNKVADPPAVQNEAKDPPASTNPSQPEASTVTK